MTTGGPDEQKADDGQQYDIHLADGLSPEQADEALRIFAALRVTRQARHEHAGESSAVQRLCSVLLADDTPCLLPLPHERAPRPRTGKPAHRHQAWRGSSRHALVVER